MSKSQTAPELIHDLRLDLLFHMAQTEKRPATRFIAHLAAMEPDPVQFLHFLGQDEAFCNLPEQMRQHLRIGVASVSKSLRL